MNPNSSSNFDATMHAGMAYQSLRAVDGTLAVHPAYQSMLAASASAIEPDRYIVGDKIAGRYEVLAIHRGSMGVVYGTFDHQEKLPRAIKTLQHRFSNDKRMQDLFREEAALWVRLEKHPFIVRAYLVQMFDTQPYVITEYVRGQAGMGGDLRAWLGHPRLTLPIAVEMALQIAQGMQHATRKIPGMVHRDLKPANVLVDDRGRAMVTDFGLVYATDSGAGTPAYMAPEQWQGLPVEPRTDIYAFGCILYEMFTGHRMFPAESIQEWKVAHLSHLPVSSRTLNPDLPAELESLVLRCIAKDMQDRPDGWDYLVSELAHWFHQITGQPAVLEFGAYDLTLYELLIACCSLGNLGKFVEALEACDRAFAIDPNNADAWAAKGVTLEDVGRREEALVAYDRALAINSNYPFLWSNKGTALYKLGRWEEALVAYDRALSISPIDAKTFQKKGATLIPLGRREDALAAFVRALDIDPYNALSWYFKGALLEDLRRREEALVAFDRSLAIDPNNTLAWFGKGGTLRSLGRREESLIAYDHLLAINPNDAETWYFKGSLLGGLGRSIEALSAYDRALSINNELANAWHLKAQTLWALSRREEALAAIDRKIAINPHDAQAWCVKGYMLSELRRREESLVAYDRGLTIDPNQPSAWYNQGLLLASMGRLHEAVVAYDHSLAIDRNNAPAWKNKGAALNSLGHRHEAQVAFDHARAIDPTISTPGTSRT